MANEIINIEEIKLTQFSHGAGCGCKIAPSVLEKILSGNMALFSDKKLLVGNSSKDDAAVYDLGNGTALISTTDFFMPIVDDAFEFGRIASANAISDVYAMGGTPVLAIAILGWPVTKLSPELAQRVIEGSRAMCAEAGIPLAGGHSIDSPEPIFGLAVNGLININHLKKNNSAKEGDLIYITKPIGVGILSTAQKRNVLNEEHLRIFINQLTTLNRVGEDLGKIKGVNAMTDVTGFGLLGHLIEMAEGSNLSSELYYSHIPVITGAKEYIAQQIVPGSTNRNWNSYSNKVSFEKEVNEVEALSLLPDPQTNGGLLIAAEASAVNEIKRLFAKHNLDKFADPIGRFTISKGNVVMVKN
jgi:selenide,water dikinase